MSTQLPKTHTHTPSLYRVKDHTGRVTSLRWGGGFKAQYKHGGELSNAKYEAVQMFNISFSFNQVIFLS